MGQVIRMIACITSNGVIGYEDDLVIKSEEYKKWLIEEVKGTYIIVGKKTYDKEVLPEEIYKNDFQIIGSEGEININTDKDISILGGQSIFELFLDTVDEIKLAEIDGIYVGDRFFPEFNVEDFSVTFIKDLEEQEAKGVLKEYKRIVGEKGG